MPRGPRQASPDRHRKLLTLPQVAEVLGVTVPTVRRMLSRGDIPFFRVGSKRRLVYQDDLDFYIDFYIDSQVMPLAGDPRPESRELRRQGLLRAAEALELRANDLRAKAAILEQ